MSSVAPAPVASLLAVCAGGWFAATAGAQQLPFLEYAQIDPTKIMRAESCGECHASEFAVWEGTPHATGFKTLHRRPRAEQIAAKLGFRLIKRQSFCFSCHYTPEVDGDSIRVVSGVSCESCHGAALDWMDIHNDYGGAGDYRGESAAHRESRIERSRAAGMRRPSDLYPVVANCFSCHTVPNEELVNVGGHSTGSSAFEFVQWSQGEIRHNFLESLRGGSTPVNAVRPIERKRPMYVVGRALDLEYSLRGMAEAKENGVYSKSMSRRVRSALAEIRAIAGSADSPEVDEMVAAVRGVQVVPNNRSALLAAAERIGAATRRFLTAGERNLAALDPLILGTAPSLDPVAESRSAIAEGDLSAPGAATPGGSGTAPSPTTPAARSTAGGGSPAATPSTGAEGTFKRKIRPASRYRTLGPGACAGCHSEQSEWWFEHAHFRAADPFFDGERKNLQIARLYGLSPAQITRGDQVCMDCHGSVISGKEGREVLDGVGCEACHGPAADWLEPHKVEGSGYAAALDLGKNDLKKMAVRAEVCTGCHYITEPRLLSAGHPSGARFDYASGMASIRHWRSPPAPAGQIASAFESALASRGPVPTVRLASAAAPAGGGATSPGGSAARSSRGTTPIAVRPEHTATRVQRARPQPFSPPASGSGGESALRSHGFPEIDEATPFEDALLFLKERLQLLFEGLDSRKDASP